MRALAVLGPTASGKTDLAVRLAERWGGEIVSVDSMQVYRGLDIGTAKPDAATLARVPHHMIDVVEPEYAYSVAEFQRDARRAVAEIHARGSPAVIAGGSGLHFRAVVDPLDFPPSDPSVRAELEALGAEAAVAALLAVDPDAGAVVDLANPRRVVRALEIERLTGATPSQRAATQERADVRSFVAQLDFCGIGLDPGDDLEDRVTARFDAMLRGGLLAEVRRLAGRLGPTAREAVGYKQLLPVVHGTSSLEEGRERAIRATLALAKRQRTFFRKDPRIRWLPWQRDPSARFGSALAAIEEAAWTS